jgi:hypothetical protein
VESRTWQPAAPAFLQRALAIALGSTALGSCALMPRELNLAPLWFHRLDDDGTPLEWDLLWPLFHYERTPEGGDDFRIRPLYRRVTEPAPASLEPTEQIPPAQMPATLLPAVEHQFLWPLGRVRNDADEQNHRLFPLWSYRSRLNDYGQRDVDWHAVFPLIWGGNSERGDEDYFAFLPFYADIPQFLVYDRFRAVLFPLFVSVDKEGHRHSFAPWPLFGWSSCAEADHSLFRALPLYGQDVEPGRFERRQLLWPFFAWGFENQDTDDPVFTFWAWPLFGFRTSREVSGWTFLWPLFESVSKQDHFRELNLFWPFYHYYWNRAEENVTQWWLWPLVGHVESDDQYGWSFLWPLIWFREYDDPDVRVEQQWVLPFFWHVRQEAEDGAREDYVKLWPIAHRTVRRDRDGKTIRGDWSVPSLFPWRDGNATGFEELYGFLWQWVAGRQRTPDDRSVDVAGRLFTRRERKGVTTASVPFLGSYERTAAGTTLRLFGFLPIPFGGGAESP